MVHVSPDENMARLGETLALDLNMDLDALMSRIREHTDSTVQQVSTIAASALCATEPSLDYDSLVVRSLDLLSRQLTDVQTILSVIEEWVRDQTERNAQVQQTMNEQLGCLMARLEGIEAKVGALQPSSARGDAPPTEAPVMLAMPRAGISAISMPATLPAGVPATITVRAKNMGTETWRARGDSNGMLHVLLGNHWLDVGGACILHEDGRAELLQDVQPGHTVDVTLQIFTPAKPGQYILEVDMVQEGVCWFSHKGSHTIKARMDVVDVETL